MENEAAIKEKTKLQNLLTENISSEEMKDITQLPIHIYVSEIEKQMMSILDKVGTSLG